MNKKMMAICSLSAAVLISAGIVHADTSKGTVGTTEYPLLVGFEFGKYDLKVSTATDAQFTAIAQKMKNYPFAKLEIEGYADSTGPEAVNQKLSDDRAAEVRKYFLKQYGLSPDRVSVRGHGDKAPIASNATSAGRRENRVAIARVYRLQPNSNTGSHNL